MWDQSCDYMFFRCASKEFHWENVPSVTLCFLFCYNIPWWAWPDCMASTSSIFLSSIPFFHLFAVSLGKDMLPLGVCTEPFLWLFRLQPLLSDPLSLAENYSVKGANHSSTQNLSAYRVMSKFLSMASKTLHSPAPVHHPALSFLHRSSVTSDHSIPPFPMTLCKLSHFIYLALPVPQGTVHCALCDSLTIPNLEVKSCFPCALSTLYLLQHSL